MGALRERLLPALLLVVVALAIASQHTTEAAEKKTVQVSDLKPVKVCAPGKTCSFSANLKVELTEHVTEGAKPPKRSHAKVDVALDFTIVSQCGSPDAQLFKLTVSSFFAGEKDTHGVAAKAIRHPLFFTVANDGHVQHVYTAKSDPADVRLFKQGLVEALAKQVHPSALARAEKAHKADKFGIVSYAYLGTDTNGHFVAEHSFTEDDEDNLVLAEETVYDQAQSADDKKALRHRDRKVFNVAGNTVGLIQRRRGKTVINKLHEVQRVKQRDTLSVGADNNAADTPVIAMPGLAATRFNVTFDLVRMSDAPVAKRCAGKGPRTSEAVEQEIKLALGDVVKRTFGAALTVAEVDEDSEYTPNETAQHTLEAESLLATGETSLDQLAPLVHSGTAKTIAAHAWKLYDDHALDTDGLKQVIASLGSSRSEAAYHQLLDLLQDHDALPELRDQAAVALIHTADEAAAPTYVVKSVASVAHDPSHPAAATATLLLGSLLDRASEDKESLHQLSLLEAQLAQSKPNDEATADRTSTLLGALANAAQPKMQHVVLPFLGSTIPEVREAAVDALRQLRASNNLGDSTVTLGDLELDEDIEAESSEEDSLINLLAESGDMSQTMLQSKNLLDGKFAISGNKNVRMKSLGQISSHWGNSTAGAAGTASLTARIFKLNRRVVHVGFTGSVRPHGNGASGRLTTTVKIVGKRVSSSAVEFNSAKDLHRGGACPQQLFGARGAQRHGAHSLYKRLYKLSAPVMLGFVPVNVRVGLHGGVGAQPILAAYADCSDKDGKNSSLTLLAGVAPTANVKATLSATASLWAVRTGVTHRFGVLKGSAPVYTRTTKTQVCAHADADFRKNAGHLKQHQWVLGKSFATKLLDWKLPAKRASLHSKCESAQVGSFVASAPKPKSSATGAPTKSADKTAADKNKKPASDLKGSTVAKGKADLQVGATFAPHSAHSVSAAQEAVIQAARSGHVNVQHGDPGSGTQIAAAASPAAAPTAGHATMVMGGIGAGLKAAVEQVKAGVSNLARDVNNNAKNAASQAAAGRSQTRGEGRQVRDSEREGIQRAEHLVGQEAAAARAVTRREGAKDRAGQRANEQSEAGREHDIENLVRRTTERALEMEAKNTRRLFDREMAQMSSVKNEVVKLEDEEKDKRMRDLVRRQANKIEAKESEVADLMKTKAMREQFRRTRNAEKTGVKDLENKMNRKDDRDLGRRGMHRVAASERRNFAAEREKEAMAGTRRLVRREGDEAKNEQGQFSAIKKKLRREERSQQERHRLNRNARRIGRQSKLGRGLRRAANKIMGDIAQQGGRSRRAARRGAAAVVGSIRSAAKTAASRLGRSKLAGVVRRAKQALEEDAESSADRATVRHSGSRTRKSTRSGARRVDAKQGRQARAQRNRSRLRAGRRGFRSAIGRARKATASVVGGMRRAVGRVGDREEAAANQRQQDAALARSSRSARRASRRAEKEQKSNMRAEKRSMRSQFQRQESAERKSVRATRRGMARAVQRQDRSQRRWGRGQASMIRRNRRNTRRSDRIERRNLRAINSDQKQNKRHMRRRMDRAAARDKREFDNDSTRESNRMNRAASAAKAAEQKMARHDRRKMDRRSRRKKDRMAREAKREAKQRKNQRKHNRRRMDRAAKRSRRRRAADKQHLSVRFSRQGKRARSRTKRYEQKQKKKIKRLETRSAGELAATQNRFSQRMGRAQQRMVAMLKPHNKAMGVESK